MGKRHQRDLTNAFQIVLDSIFNNIIDIDDKLL